MIVLLFLNLTDDRTKKSSQPNKKPIRGDAGNYSTVSKDRYSNWVFNVISHNFKMWIWGINRTRKKDVITLSTQDRGEVNDRVDDLGENW